MCIRDRYETGDTSKYADHYGGGVHLSLIHIFTPDDILAAVEMHKDEHMVQPKLAYISNSTETGTIYTKAELKRCV